MSELLHVNLIHELESFLSIQSDGEWEHGEGIQISTIDNPGWEVFVDLDETMYSDAIFDEIVDHRTENDWIVCRVRNGKFEGFGGPRNLKEVLNRFFAWVKVNS